MNTIEQMAEALQRIVDATPETRYSNGNIIAARNALYQYKREAEIASTEEKCIACHQRTSYNGWANYSTWGVGLVIDNTQMIQRRSVERAESAESVYEAGDRLKADIDRDMEEIEKGLEQGISAVIRKYAVKQYAKDRIEYLTLLSKQLLQDALDGVDWADLAKHYRGEE